MEKHANVDKWWAANPRWRAEAKALRPILLDCGLSEAVKWGKPCYGHVDNNIAIVQSFKGFLALLFVKGILLEAPEGVLESQGKNTHSSRRVCFRSTDDVKRLEPTLRDLVRQAVAVEDNIVAPPHLFDVIHPETHRLVQAGDRIKKEDGDGDRVDEGGCENGQHPAVDQITPQAELQGSLAFACRATDENPALAQFIAIAAAPFGKLFFEFGFQ